MTKKRYTKKKISFSKDSHTLPYDKYRVEWVDCVSDSGWAEKKEFTNMLKLFHDMKANEIKNSLKRKKKTK